MAENVNEKQRRITPEDKVKILGEVMMRGRKISDVADEYKVHPNQIILWRKDLVLKKNNWPHLGRRKMSLAERTAVIGILVMRAKELYPDSHAQRLP